MSDISRRDFHKSMAAPALGLAAPAARPNILVICSDQHSGKVMGVNGHPLVRTPNLDRLAASGVNFRNSYSCGPVCVPGRAALMSGMYPSDVGVYCNSTVFDGRVPTWGNYLRDAGYAAWATGKLDLAHGKDYGFREVNTGHGHSTAPDITSLFRRPLCYRLGERSSVAGRTRPKPHHDIETAHRALEFLKTEAPSAGKPWAAFVGFLQPHPPFTALAKHLALYPESEIPAPKLTPEYLESLPLPLQALRNFKLISSPIPESRVRQARAAYYAMITELDEYAGLLLDALRQTGQDRNTVVIYTSDHGEALGDNGLWLKNNLLEGAARVPLLISGPGLPAGRTVTEPVSHVDLVASILDAAGIETPPTLRGRSLLPMARGERGSHSGFAYSESHSEGNSTGSFMVRRGEWKYIHYVWDSPLLFNLEQDPGEINNLAGRKEHAAVERELHALLASQVDPETVTERAFREQERFLQNLVRSKTRDQFYDMVKGRLGPAQARALTNLRYPA